MDFIEVLWLKPLYDRLNLPRVSTNTLTRDNEPQEHDMVGHKGTLLSVGIKTLSGGSNTPDKGGPRGPP